MDEITVRHIYTARSQEEYDRVAAMLKSDGFNPELRYQVATGYRGVSRYFYEILVPVDEYMNARRKVAHLEQQQMDNVDQYSKELLKFVGISLIAPVIAAVILLMTQSEEWHVVFFVWLIGAVVLGGIQKMRQGKKEE